LKKLFEITSNSSYLKSIKILNNKLLEIQENENISILGRFYEYDYSDFGSPHSASDGIYTESLAYAYEIAEFSNDSYNMSRFKTGIILGVHNLINLQYVTNDEKTNGAIRYNVDDNRIRVDSTQHTIEALSKVLDVFNRDADAKWNYIYNLKTDELTALDYDENWADNDFVWYSLTIGTIISIGLLFVIYFIIKFRKK
jgi:hypothetical protein